MVDLKELATKTMKEEKKKQEEEEKEKKKQESKVHSTYISTYEDREC